MKKNDREKRDVNQIKPLLSSVLAFATQTVIALGSLTFYARLLAPADTTFVILFLAFASILAALDFGIWNLLIRELVVERIKNIARIRIIVFYYGALSVLSAFTCLFLMLFSAQAMQVWEAVFICFGLLIWVTQNLTQGLMTGLGGVVTERLFRIATNLLHAVALLMLFYCTEEITVFQVLAAWSGSLLFGRGITLILALRRLCARIARESDLSLQSLLVMPIERSEVYEVFAETRLWALTNISNITIWRVSLFIVSTKGDNSLVLAWEFVSRMVAAAQGGYNLLATSILKDRLVVKAHSIFDDLRLLFFVLFLILAFMPVTIFYGEGIIESVVGSAEILRSVELYLLLLLVYMEVMHSYCALLLMHRRQYFVHFHGLTAACLFIFFLAYSAASAALSITNLLVTFILIQLVCNTIPIPLIYLGRAKVRFCSSLYYVSLPFVVFFLMLCITGSLLERSVFWFPVMYPLGVSFSLAVASWFLFKRSSSR